MRKDFTNEAFRTTRTRSHDRQIRLRGNGSLGKCGASAGPADQPTGAPGAAVNQTLSTIGELANLPINVLSNAFNG